MKYYLDTEFNGFGGELLSLGLVRQDGKSIFLVTPQTRISDLWNSDEMDPWVWENVIPILLDVPSHVEVSVALPKTWGRTISSFLWEDELPNIIADWPSDIADFCNLLISGPGRSYHMPEVTQFTILRHIDVYPTTLEGAVQHNAWWDAMALRHYCMENGL